MELRDTIELMISSDYKARFRAEYHQTKIRYEKLKKFNTRIEAAYETQHMKNAMEIPKHDCPENILYEQQSAMERYLYILEVRAEIEGIEL